MEMTTALSMPAAFAVIEADELTYLDGGAETGIWRDWSFPNFVHGFVLALGSASITAGSNYILQLLPSQGLGGAFSSAGSRFMAFSSGQKVLFAACAAAAAYTIWYEVRLIYNTLESIYYTIFPRQQAEEPAPVADGLSLAAA